MVLGKANAHPLSMFLKDMITTNGYFYVVLSSHSMLSVEPTA